MRPEISTIVGKKISKKGFAARSIATFIIAGSAVVGGSNNNAYAEEYAQWSPVLAASTSAEFFPTSAYGPILPTTELISMQAGQEYTVGIENAQKTYDEQIKKEKGALKANQEKRVTAQAIEMPQPLERAPDLSVTEIVKLMYFIESTNGQNDSCKNQGKVNGYGYGQNEKEWTCFDSLEEVTAKVTKWVQDRKNEGFSTREIFCYYQTGDRNADCSNYHTVLGIQNP